MSILMILKTSDGSSRIVNVPLMVRANPMWFDLMHKRLKHPRQFFRFVMVHHVAVKGHTVMAIRNAEGVNI